MAATPPIVSSNYQYNAATHLSLEPVHIRSPSPRTERRLLSAVVLTDTRIQTQSEIYVEAPEEYVDLVRKVSGAALHTEAAREKLAPAEWETNLRHRLEAAAAELHLEVAQEGFASIPVQPMIGERCA